MFANISRVIKYAILFAVVWSVAEGSVSANLSWSKYNQRNPEYLMAEWMNENVPSSSRLFADPYFPWSSHQDLQGRLRDVVGYTVGSKMDLPWYIDYQTDFLGLRANYHSVGNPSFGGDARRIAFWQHVEEYGFLVKQTAEHYKLYGIPKSHFRYAGRHLSVFGKQSSKINDAIFLSRGDEVRTASAWKAGDWELNFILQNLHDSASNVVIRITSLDDNEVSDFDFVEEFQVSTGYFSAHKFQLENLSSGGYRVAIQCMDGEVLLGEIEGQNEMGARIFTRLDVKTNYILGHGGSGFQWIDAEVDGMGRHKGVLSAELKTEFDLKDQGIIVSLPSEFPDERGYVDCWVSPYWNMAEEPTATRIIWSIGYGYQPNILRVYKSPGPRVNLSILDASRKEHWSSEAQSGWSKGQWHHLEAYWNARKGLVLYINGVPNNGTATLSTFPFSLRDKTLYIGTTGPAGSPTSIRVRDVVVGF